MVKKLIGVVAVLVLVVLGVGVWYFFIRDDSVEKRTADCGADGCAESTVASLDGTWSAVAGQSEASLVITETIGGVADHQVEGNADASGDLEVTGTEVTDAGFTVDLTTLEFTDAPPGFDVANRARAMESTGLETGEFPQATFVLSEPIALPDGATSGQPVTASATGDLTLHGVTKPITFDVEIVADGDTFRLTPAEFVPIVLADYDISVDAPGFVADIADQGSFDFLIVVEQETP